MSDLRCKVRNPATEGQCLLGRRHFGNHVWEAMPDDRPVSPEERLREVVRWYADENHWLDGAAGEWVVERGNHVSGDGFDHDEFEHDHGERAREVLAALSTPAADDEWTYTTETPKSADLFGTAPSPRGEAVETLTTLDDTICDALLALDRGHQNPRPWLESALQQVRALSAARPSSPTPEETHAQMHADADVGAHAIDLWWRDHLEACGDGAATESPDLPSYSLAWAVVHALARRSTIAFNELAVWLGSDRPSRADVVRRSTPSPLITPGDDATTKEGRHGNA